MIETEIVVIGSGPGGYTAAFYAADKGKKVVLVEQDKRLGGVCLNRGCIPSKALLHATGLIGDAKESSLRGIDFAVPVIHLDKLRVWKESILSKLSGGISTLASKRGVEVLCGKGSFKDSHTLKVETAEGEKIVSFKQAIIATGSRPALPPAFNVSNSSVMTSTEALELSDIPKKLLVVGGGYIGMELGTVYAAIGSEIVLVEALDTVLLGADSDLIRPVMRTAEKAFKEVRLNTKVLEIAASGKQAKVVMEVGGEKKEEIYDRVLVSVGRAPNSEELGIKNTKVITDEKGFIKVNSKKQTHDPSIYAIGDVAGGALLAHKASKEARIAVEAILNEPSDSEESIIPAVVFTDPEVAWAGLTEAEAQKKGIEIKVTRFSWAASGKALTHDKTDGLTKLIIDPKTERILGVGIVGVGAGELISEGVLAIKMGATAKDLAHTVHPHPTLSETLMEAAEVFYGTSSHTLPRKKP